MQLVETKRSGDHLMPNHGKGGRPPKPLHLHLLQGTFREDRHGSKEEARTEVARAQLSTRAHRPPSWLSAEGQREWRRVERVMRAAGTLKEAGLGVLAAYCRIWVLVRQADRQLKRDGLTVKGAHGVPVKHPALTVLHQALAHLRAYSAELGITPASQARARAPQSGDPRSADWVPPELSGDDPPPKRAKDRKGRPI